MNSLKAALKRKLEESEHLKNDLEALPRANDFIAHSKAIEGWRTAWIRNFIHEKLKIENNQKGFVINTPKQSGGENKLRRIVNQDARNDLSQRRDFLIILPEEIQELEIKLCRNASNSIPTSLPSSPAGPITSGESIFDLAVPRPLDQMISLEEYQQAISEFSAYLENERKSNGYLDSDSLWFMRWFTTKLFVRLVNHENDGLVPVSSIMEYVTKKVVLYRIRLELMKYDVDGTGYITKEKLALYLATTEAERPKSGQGACIDAFVFEAFFLLDPHRTNKIKIAELLGFRILPFNSLGVLVFGYSPAEKRFFHKLEMFRELLRISRADSVSLSIFCEKFPEISQRLWRDDVRVKAKKVRLLQSIVQRLIYLYEKSSSNKENMGISFKMFLEITLAWEYLDTSLSSISFFFRALDTDDKGYMDTSDLQRHYKSIDEGISKLLGSKNNNNDSEKYNDKNWIYASFREIQSQIRDILEKESISRITPQNLFKARDGHIVIASLINLESSLIIGCFKSSPTGIDFILRKDHDEKRNHSFI